MNKPQPPASDPCESLLRDALRQAPRPLLWVVDEHIAHPSRWLKESAAGVTVLSNRYDSYLDAHQAGIPAYFNDMEPSALSAQFNSMVYRISKEKALVHHVINISKQTLQAEGSLILIGGKQEGIKTYIDKAAEFLGPIIQQENGHHSTRMAVLQHALPGTDAHALDDKEYPRYRLIAEESGLQFYSKPGQFGWDKTDQGSQFLVAHFDAFFAEYPPGEVLDLGCGYGYLSLHISRYSPTRILATDNNAAAVGSCRFNLNHNDIHQGSVVADDCGRHLRQKFDTLICNPPFHQGFSTSGEMTERFIEQTRRLLKPSGQALFVVNQFIPLEQKAAGRFRRIEGFARNKSFKLVRLAAPVT